MGSDPQFQIPVIKFSTGSPDLERGTEGWHNLCKRVREACEDYGCFEILYDKIPLEQRAKAFSVIKQLFGLPLDTKKKNVNPKPYHSYFGQYAPVPLYESLGLEDASDYESVKSFLEMMWPNGNDEFCQTILSFVKLVEELNHIVDAMILDGYGVKEKKESIAECKTLLRVMKYQAPPPGETMPGLSAHSDKFLTTILCEDEVAGLEVETKDGQWIKWLPSPSSFIFIVGDILKAWSNGRMHAVKHRVTMNGNKDRYSLAAFADLVEGSIIKAPQELVDEDHPRVFREFNSMDFLTFSSSKEQRAIASEMQLVSFAGM